MSLEESGSDGLQCGFSRGLKRLWGLNIPIKIKIHTWRMIFNALPTLSNLLIRKVHVEPHCSKCKKGGKNHYSSHLVLPFCPTGLATLFFVARPFRFSLGLDWRSISMDGGAWFHYWLYSICFTIPLLEHMDHQKLIGFSGRYFLVFRCINQGEEVQGLILFIFKPGSWRYSANPKLSHWSPPQFGVIKVNVDAAVYLLMDHFGVGVVGRDNSETLFCAEWKYISGSLSSLLAELIAIQVGISRAISMGWNSIIIEIDASNAVKAIRKLHPYSMEAHVVTSIESLCSKLECISIVYSLRSTNQLAHEYDT